MRNFGYLTRMQDGRYPKIACNGYVHGVRKKEGKTKKTVDQHDKGGLYRTEYDITRGNTHDAGQESVESDHR